MKTQVTPRTSRSRPDSCPVCSIRHKPGVLYRAQYDLLTDQPARGVISCRARAVRVDVNPTASRVAAVHT